MYQFINRRSFTINKAIQMADPIHILEIGGGREEPEKYSSTFLWCKYGRTVITINESPDDVVKACKEKGFHNIRAFPDLSKWLPTHYGNFDIVCMDAWGPDDDNYQEKYLEAYTLLKARLGNSSVIIIDNTPKLSTMGNGFLVIEEARRDGWVIAKQDYQVLLAKKMTTSSLSRKNTLDRQQSSR